MRRVLSLFPLSVLLGFAHSAAAQDQPDVALALSPGSVAETAAATTVTVTASLAASRTEDTEVTLSVVDGSAKAGTDFAAVSDFVLTIPANDSSATATFTLTPTSDTLVEGDETVRVTGVAGDLSVGVAVLTLTDDPNDTATLGFAASSGAIAEADAGRTAVTVSITNNVLFERAQDISISLSGTATHGQDFTFVNSRGLTFTKPLALRLPGGETEVTGTITAVNDRLKEAAETIVIEASYAGAVIGAARTVTIADNDEAPALTLRSLTLTPPDGSESVAMYPAFDAGILHYAAGCGDEAAWTLNVSGESGVDRLSVNGTQTVVRKAQLTLGGLGGEDDIEIVLSNGAGENNTYTIHCLPTDYPRITITKEAGAFDGLIVLSLIHI